MVRKKQQPAGALRMYRHFAIVTVALTAALALFADGESREAMAEEIAAREQRNELAHASAEKFGKPRLVRKEPASAGSFGSDGGDFGEPMDDAGGGNPSGYISGPVNAPSAYAYFGLSEAEWEALSEEQRAALRREVQEEADRAAAPERQAQIERLKAASAGRAGGRGDED